MEENRFIVNASLDRMERSIIEKLLEVGYRAGIVQSEEIADAMKSIKAKVGFSEEEKTELRKIFLEKQALAKMQQPGFTGRQ